MSPPPSASITAGPEGLVLAGAWTALGMATLAERLATLPWPPGQAARADATQLTALDTAGAWLLQGLLVRLQSAGTPLQLQGLRPEFAQRLDAVAQRQAELAAAPAALPPAAPGRLESLGRSTTARLAEAVAMLAFVGESASALMGWARHPQRVRWRPILFNIRSGGVDALPIVGLMAFLVGVVIAYQSADQLRRYGANLFIADIVGIAMLREFAPLIVAIIIAGRSGSAYAAQIGTMAVTEEIDAMRTIAIAPLELLMLPKLLALLVVLPLLTVFADVLGVAGGMVMAQSQLGVDFAAFGARFVKAVGVNTALVGLGKATVFGAIIAVVGCFQGFRTRGGADSVGRQTTRSVVQAIFLVIVVDALFSVVFNALKI